MWNNCKSILLSRICVVAFMLLLILAAVLAPWLTDRLLTLTRTEYFGTKAYFLITAYTGVVPAGVLLISLYKLLRRIENGQVFIKKNVYCLRYISWCCFLGAVICLASAFYYIPWALVGVAAAFMGLIVRVVKNVFSRAVELQDEADFTI